MKKLTLLTGVILLAMLFAFQLPVFGSPQAALTVEPQAFNSLTGSTSLSYTLCDVTYTNVSMKIYNLQGTLIRTFDEGIKNSGTYSITWDGRDDNNNVVPEGYYRAVLSTSTESGGIYHSITILGGSGTGIGQFTTQKGLAVAPDGSIVVADTGNNRIQKYNSGAWSVLADFDVNCPAGFSSPYAVAAGPDGSIYAADMFHNRVVKLGPAGWQVFATGTNFNNVSKSLVQPNGVAVDPDGSVFVLDSVNNRVVKFSPGGQPLLEWTGAQLGDFLRPHGIAAGNSGVYVIHYTYVNSSTQKKVSRFSNNGEPLPWSPGTDLTNPSAVTVDGSGNVYVAYAAGSADHRIVKFGPAGEFVTEWGSNGTAAGQLGEVYGIDVDPAGNVYVSESSNFRIQVFGPPSGGQAVCAEATLLVDNTPPVLVPVTSMEANENGWYNQDVTVTFMAFDALSGILDGSVTAPVTVITEGEGQVTNGSASDKAGNVAVTSITLNIDKTPPVIAFQSPADGSEYLLHQTGIAANWDASDSLSGIDTTSGAASGSPVDTSQVGTRYFTVTAADKAGNTITKTAAYFVHYVYSGVLSPIKSDGTSTFKLGSTIPVKFRLTDVNGITVENAAATLSLTKTGEALFACRIKAASAFESAAENNFRYDAEAAHYIYELDTSNLSAGTWRLDIVLDDGTVKSQDINLR